MIQEIADWFLHVPGIWLVTAGVFFLMLFLPVWLVAKGFLLPDPDLDKARKAAIKKGDEARAVKAAEWFVREDRNKIGRS